MTEAEKEVYCGADLHGSNVVLSICDGAGHRVLERRVRGDLEAVVKTLAPYQDRLANVAVESTYNWYWFVDGLRDQGVPVAMANPAQLGAYKGVKETNDYTDARWLAELARLGVVPESYIYPRPPRAIRDVLRRRSMLVRQRTAHRNSLAAWRARHAVQAKGCTSFRSLDALDIDPFVRLEARTLLKAIARFSVLIAEIEKEVLGAVRRDPGFDMLVKMVGIGPILGMTIVLESGEFSRFASSGHYASYCRTVRSRRTSNGKGKGRNNARNGNPYLAWAFSEAAHFAIRYDPRAKAWFERKKKRSNEPIAYKSLASKLAKAVWHVMQGDEYEPEKLFR
jgi:transposase